MISKKGKQLMVKKHNNYNIVSGTVDNKNPKALYVNISAWGEPLIADEVNYTNVIREFTKKLKKSIHNNINTNLFHKERTIVDFDMRESGIVFGKRSYMNCEVTFYQKNSFKLQEKAIQDTLDEILEKIMEEVLDSSIYFEFHKGKK